MQIQIRRVRDRISPELRALYKNSRNKKDIHAAIGLGLVSMTKRAFNDPSLRPKAWPAKSDGSAARLRDTGTLAKSVRLVQVNARGLRIGSDRPYAAIHQLGGKTKARVITARGARALRFSIGGRIVFARSVRHPGSRIPARPYMPFSRNGRLTAKASKLVGNITRRKLMRGTSQA